VSARQDVLDEEQAMFAPIAAIVALLGSAVGARGKQVLVLMLGVNIGVLVGELLVGILKGGPDPSCWPPRPRCWWCRSCTTTRCRSSRPVSHRGSFCLLLADRARRASGERWPPYTCFAQITRKTIQGALSH
jgi:hypothetical protein